MHLSLSLSDGMVKEVGFGLRALGDHLWGELFENKTNTEEERGKKWKETLLGSCQMTLGFVDEISPQIPSSCA